MKITIIHGQSHKGTTYTLTHTVLKHLQSPEDTVQTFFLPTDGPDFCVGCNACFIKGEDRCPSAHKVQPIADAMAWADVIILDSPNYVMEMSGSMKNLMDHLAYRWVTHRPHGAMFKKIGITLCSSAGAPARGTAKSMARQLKWMCVSKVYILPFTSNAMVVSDLSPKKQQEMEQKAKKIAKAVARRMAKPHASLRARITFFIFRKMQSGSGANWNPRDRDWWVKQEWTKKKRPWK